MHEIINAGIVVYIMLLTCLNRFVSVTPAAKFVESEIGDILSPITAPEITAWRIIKYRIFPHLSSGPGLSVL